MPTLDEILERTPRAADLPAQRFTAPPGMPSVWIAQLLDRFNYYSKNCCSQWQPPVGQGGIIQRYAWRAIRGPWTSDQPILTPDFQEVSDPGAADDGCFQARTWPDGYEIVRHTAPPSTWPGRPVFWGSNLCAVNLSEFDYSLKQGRIMIQNSGCGPSGASFNEVARCRANDIVAMTWGVVRDRLWPLCPEEPRPDLWVPVFSRFRVGVYSPCGDPTGGQTIPPALRGCCKVTRDSDGALVDSLCTSKAACNAQTTGGFTGTWQGANVDCFPDGPFPAEQCGA